MTITKVTAGLISAEASAIDLNIDANTLYIDASENKVGIGTSSPDRQLSINDFSGNGTLSINASTSGASTVYFADGSSVPNIYAGYIQYSHADNSMQFANNGGSERARITSDGTVLVGKTAEGTATDGIELNRNFLLGFISSNAPALTRPSS